MLHPALDHSIWAPLTEGTALSYRACLYRIKNYLTNTGALRNNDSYNVSDQELIDYIITNATDENVYQYLYCCIRDGLRAEYVATELQAVKWTYNNKSETNKRFDSCDELIKSKSECIYSERARYPGLDWNDVDIICDTAAEERTLVAYRDIALIRIMSDCLLRAKEVIQLNFIDIKGTKLTFDGMTFTIGHKTRRAVERYTMHADIKEGALFLGAGRGLKLKNSRLGMQGVRMAIKKRTLAANIRIPHSGNSFRVGSIMSLLRSGASLKDVQTLSRYKTLGGLLRYVNRLESTGDIMRRFRYDQRTAA